METSTNETRQKYRIEVEPKPFDPCGDLKVTSTRNLIDDINKILACSFSDYYGCGLTVQYQPDRMSFAIIPTVVFKVLADEEYKKDGVFAFMPSSAADGGDLVGRVQRITRSATLGKLVTMTQDGKDALEDFMFDQFINHKNVNWEESYRTLTTAGNSFVIVNKFDIYKFLQAIYGVDDPKEPKVFYQITPSRIINSQYQYKTADEWSVIIQRIHADGLRQAAEDLHMFMPEQFTGLQGIFPASGK